MYECLICYESKSSFKNLHNNHRICMDCYKKLETNKCPFCRHPIQQFKKKEILPYSNLYTHQIYINMSRIERRLKRNRRKDFKDYDDYLQHRRKIKQRYKKKS